MPQHLKRNRRERVFTGNRSTTSYFTSSPPVCILYPTLASKNTIGRDKNDQKITQDWPNMATSTTESTEETETTPTVSYPLDKHRRSLFDLKESEMLPPYFSQAQLGKLEDKFSQRKWPDEFTIQMIAIECNMLAKHVTVRIKSY